MQNQSEQGILKSINPYNGELLAEFSFFSPEQIYSKIEQASQAQVSWKKLSVWQRTSHLILLADLMDSKKSELATLISSEMGKPIKEAIAEIEKCVNTTKYYASHGEAMLQAMRIDLGNGTASIQFEPLGLVLGIFPWNYPFWQVLRFAIPALCAGNALVYKHAENVPQCALAIEKLFKEIGLPEGLVSNIFCEISFIEAVIAHKSIKAVSLTGSENAGRSVAALAGKYLKKAVLELGGSDPFIVLADADIEKAAEAGVASRFQNTGQSCVAAKRFIIHEAVFDDFTKAFAQKMYQLHSGNPLDVSCDLGVLARPDLKSKLEAQVMQSVNQGATILYGGTVSESTFFEPAILYNIKKGMPAYHEELFGPVAAFFKIANAEEAIALANDTDFGLGASVWSNNPEVQQYFASALDCGMVFINALTKSSPELPFGGTKNSGIGRELSEFGLREFVNIKTIVHHDHH
jgi:succinate-semialdehyde dehydrogenase/glutarate-semialdehyde dehydrogenase